MPKSPSVRSLCPDHVALSYQQMRDRLGAYRNASDKRPVMRHDDKERRGGSDRVNADREQLRNQLMVVSHRKRRQRRGRDQDHREPLRIGHPLGRERDALQARAAHFHDLADLAGVAAGNERKPASREISSKSEINMFSDWS